MATCVNSKLKKSENQKKKDDNERKLNKAKSKVRKIDSSSNDIIPLPMPATLCSLTLLLRHLPRLVRN